MGRGKSFESELRKAFQEKHPDAYVERNPDRLTGKWGANGRAISLPSPPDLLVNAAHGNYLIECKAQAGKSIPFMRNKETDTLSPHQHDFLIRYDKISVLHRGFVALNFYNNKKGRFNKAWLVPIDYWNQYQSRHPRKSLAMKHLEHDLPSFELIRLPGGRWELPKWI